MVHLLIIKMVRKDLLCEAKKREKTNKLRKNPLQTNSIYVSNILRKFDALFAALWSVTH